eukprot:2485725-Prymnesium_polylepis.1
MALGCKRRLKKRRDFFLLTDLPWAVLHGVSQKTQSWHMIEEKEAITRKTRRKPRWTAKCRFYNR